MAKFVIRGQEPLSGEIAVFGSKNAAIKMIAAAISINGTVVLDNVPDILDIQKIINILQKMGAVINRQGHQLRINTEALRPGDPDADLVRSMRASIVLVGPLLARFGKVKIPHPGGCIIGSRPIDRHLKAFQDLGIQVETSEDLYEFQKKGPLRNRVHFEKISVTGTENVLLFAAGKIEKVLIANAAIEPEVMDLIEFLKKAGAKITVQDREIEIEGKSSLNVVNHRVIPDRIEAGTLAILAATTKSNLKITHLNPKNLTVLLEKFTKMGIEFEKDRHSLYIKKPQKILASDIETSEYPGFPTDLQAPMGVLLSQAEGESRIIENIFESRLGYLEELQKMGAKIRILNNREAIITGPTELRGAKIQSLDLRSGATLLIAGLIARGTTEIQEAENIDRGYEKIEERLSKIGANIKRFK